MKRNITKQLEDWKNWKKRKPLLLFGARQVGKTYLLREFGRSNFENVAYFDLEKQADARAVFEGNISPAEILKKLGQVQGKKIEASSTLIIIDEIQASNRALASLKYFCEEMPKAYVVAAGSLLGVAVNRQDYSAPVGKVETLHLHPFTFDEFLTANGNEQLIDAIRCSFETNEAYFLHEKAIELFWIYVLVGGMPEVVRTFVDTSDFSEVSKVQNEIIDLYVADMAKYATPFETARIHATWQSMPSQLLKENRKFQYRLIRSGARASQFETALSWLETAGLINKCTNISSPQLPLALHENNSAFKMYVADTGLLCAMLGARPSNILNIENRRTFDAGPIVENCVAQSLVSNSLKLAYWTSQGKAEIDFVADFGESVGIPIEVKSSENVRSRSLNVFREKYKPPYSIRLSPKNFGFENGIKSVPLYATFCLK